MIKLKHISSYFLLLVYGLSFGHQIIPHHHHEINAIHSHSADGHDHCDTEKETHNHVAHKGHFDEGFIDYLACVLGGHEHNPSTECEFLARQIDQKNQVKKQNITGDIAPNTAVSLLLTALSNLDNCTLALSGATQNVLAEKRAKRGPPMS